MIQHNNPWDDEKDKDSSFAMIDDALDDIEREKEHELKTEYREPRRDKISTGDI